MFKITEKEFKKFINELRTKRILIIGEIHGVKENITVLKELVKIIGKKEKNNNIYISLEWPYKLQRQVNNFLQGRISIGEFENYLKKFDYGDGRITKEHVNFLKKLSIENRRIYIWCLDKDEKDWNKRDKTMYKRWKNLNKIFIMGITLSSWVIYMPEKRPLNKIINYLNHLPRILKNQLLWF